MKNGKASLLSKISLCLLILFFLSIFYSCTNQKHKQISDMVDTTMFTTMNPDSVYSLGYEYYNSGDDKNANIIYNYSLRHGSKVAKLALALKKDRYGDKLHSKKLLQELMELKYPDAYREYGLLLLREKDKDFLYYFDTAIQIGQKNFVFSFLGDLYFNGKCPSGGYDYSIEKDTVKGYNYYFKAANTGNYEIQFKLGRLYFQRKMYDSSLVYYKMCLNSVDEDYINEAKVNINLIDSILVTKKSDMP